MRTQRRIAYAFAACLVSLLAGTAMADDGSGNFNAFLQGQYQVNGTVTCSTGPTVESIGSEPTLFDTFTGVITYDGHGHATLAAPRPPGRSRGRQAQASALRRAVLRRARC